MIKNCDKWYQVGVTSGGDIDEGSNDFFLLLKQFLDAFTRVSFACDWIKYVTNEESLCISIK